jgi:hypothetical protein
MPHANDDARPPGPPRRRRGSSHRRPSPRPSSTLEEDFGPGPAGDPGGTDGSRARSPGPLPGLACAGEDCVLKPAADLIGKFALGLGRRGHGVSLSRAALSGIEFMKALRDFLDEEIALAEKAAGKASSRAERYEKIRVE